MRTMYPRSNENRGNNYNIGNTKELIIGPAEKRSEKYNEHGLPSHHDHDLIILEKIVKSVELIPLITIGFLFGKLDN